MANPLAVIFGCSGTTLSSEESAFFRNANPLGFILFARNVDSPEQIRALCKDLRNSVGREDAPILVDQEGGRVQRLTPPHWRDIPAPGTFADLHLQNSEAGLEAARLNARLIAHDLRALGIDVDCLPVLDVPQSDSHPFLKGRAAGHNADQSIVLGRAACDGLLDGGVLPVIKHIPGHGRATVDSHHDLPQVTASHDELNRVDFAPFKSLAQMPWAMTAHIIYTALDPENAASTSKRVIEDVIRGDIGFDGFLVSDDVGMNALAGSVADRVRNCLNAGSDAVLQCDGDMANMDSVADVVREMDAPAMSRFRKGREHLRPPDELDRAATSERLTELLSM